MNETLKITHSPKSANTPINMDSLYLVRAFAICMMETWILDSQQQCASSRYSDQHGQPLSDQSLCYMHDDTLESGLTNSSVSQVDNLISMEYPFLAHKIRISDDFALVR